MPAENITDKDEYGNPLLELNEGEIMIVDEADDVFLDKMMQIEGKGALVCLTATIPDCVEDEYESIYLRKWLGF